MRTYLDLILHPSWDILFLLFVVVLGFFWGLSRGKKKLILMIVAVYMTRAVFDFIPFNLVTGGRSEVAVVAIHAGVFVALVMCIMFFLNGALKTPYDGNWLSVLIFSILFAGLLGTMLFQLTTPETVRALGISPFAERIFGGFGWTRWWIFAPIFGILFL